MIAKKLAFSQKRFRNMFFLSKIRYFFPQTHVFGINRYWPIRTHTNIIRYAQDMSDHKINRYKQMWTDLGLILEKKHDIYRYKHMNRCRHMKRYGQTLTTLLDTSIWTDIYIDDCRHILTCKQIFDRYWPRLMIFTDTHTYMNSCSRIDI